MNMTMQNLDQKIYIPCVRWKLGEYTALNKLSSTTKDLINPLIEVPELGYDFDTGKLSSELETHVANFAKRMMKNWNKRKCFIDIYHIQSSSNRINGQHPIRYIFDELRKNNVIAVPVLRINSDIPFQEEVSGVISIDSRGLCLRVNIEEAVKNDFSPLLDDMISRLNLPLEECDLIIDLRTPNFNAIDSFSIVLSRIVKNFPNLNKWRSFGIIGTSFPQSLGGIPTGTSFIPRDEWNLFSLLHERLKNDGTRLPIFGDYTINHPNILKLDMRLVKPSASVRYATDKKWAIIKGQNVRDHGFSQYKSLCKSVVNSKYYYGEKFSAGDKYIHDCEKGDVSTGNLSTWRWVGTNHHIETVVSDLANLYAV